MTDTSAPTPRLPGFALVLLTAVPAWLLGREFPVLGGPVAGVLLGLAVGVVLRPSERIRHGITLAAGPVLQLAVVVLGARLTLGQLVDVGAGSLPVMLGTLAVCLLLAWIVGRALRIPANLRALIGAGTGICGASAIAAVAPAIRAQHRDVGYAISVIFFCNIAAVLLFPPLGHALGMGQQAFGLLAGTAINDTSSVVAAANSYGSAATDHAVVVKLVRTLMIIPIVLVLARRTMHVEGSTGDSGSRPVTRMVPRFLIGFLFVVAASSLGLVPEAARQGANVAASALITIALTGIGMLIDVRSLRTTGVRPLLLGLLLWVAVTGTSLGLQAMGPWLAGS